jgi:hypothetical protein
VTYHRAVTHLDHACDSCIAKAQAANLARWVAKEAVIAHFRAAPATAARSIYLVKEWVTAWGEDARRGDPELRAAIDPMLHFFVTRLPAISGGPRA